MKQLHVHVLFATQPTVLQRDDAKWMIEHPRVNFAITARSHAATGVEHLGIQVESSEELAEVETPCCGAA